MGCIDADKAVGVTFNYDGKLDTKLDAHFQAALLYTSANGQRRVRCINIVAAVNDGGIETMKAVDQDAVVAIMAKQGKQFLRHDFYYRRTRGLEESFYANFGNSGVENSRQIAE